MFCTSTWLMVRQDSAPEKTKGGIILPDNKKDSHKPYIGTVELAGVDCKYVKKGDVVRFDRTGAFTEDIEDETDPSGKTTYAFFKEEFVMLVANRDYETKEVNCSCRSMVEDDGK